MSANPSDADIVLGGWAQLPIPLSVTLAAQPWSVGRLLTLAPGSILQVPSSGTPGVVLEAGGQAIAQGQCVRQGDRLGLRIESLARVAKRANTDGANA